jgi:hypothetical protein
MSRKRIVTKTDTLPHDDTALKVQPKEEHKHSPFGTEVIQQDEPQKTEHNWIEENLKAQDGTQTMSLPPAAPPKSDKVEMHTKFSKFKKSSQGE